jgi:GT2 family glycosyltransferase
MAKGGDLGSEGGKLANLDTMGASALIVNYNGAACLPACIESLKREPLVRQIIVVDNGSVDGSEHWLKEHHPDVILIETGSNQGFGRGCNLGAKAATEPLLLVINYDAMLSPGLGDAIGHLARTPAAAMVGGRLVSILGHPQPSVGYPQTPLRLVVSWLGISRLLPWVAACKREVDDERFYSTPHDGVAWACGALMLVRKCAWDSVQGMDPGYFLYMEDVDLCERLASSGWRLDYLPTFQAVHQPRQGAPVVSGRALLSTIDSYHLFISNRHGELVARSTCAGLFAVFLLRASVLSLCFWRPAPLKEGATYFRGSLRALRHALGQKFPWGPPC